MASAKLGAAAVPLYILSTVIVLFLLVPLVLPFVLSVSDTPFVTFPPRGFTLQWYWIVLKERDFTDSLQLSLILGALTAVGAMLLGTPAAIGLVRYKFAGRDVIQSLLLSPLIFPALVTGIALLRFFSSIGSQNAFANLLIGHVLVTIPYVVRTVSASLLQLDPAIEEVARTLGANRLMTFWWITRPQIMPGLFAGGIFAFVTSFDNYAISMWLFDAANVPLPLTMFSLISRMFDPGIAAIASLMIVLSLVLVLLVERIAGLQRAMNM